MFLIKDVVEFWFEGVTDETVINKRENPFRKWFCVNPHFDQQVSDLFAQVIHDVSEKTNSPQDASESLALILLFDQLSRNIFRNSPQAYAYDIRALHLSLQLLDKEQDQKLMLIERLFAYMPLMHAEDLNAQNLSVQYFSLLHEEAEKRCPFNAKYYEQNLVHARKYQQIIKRYGRFPHRNHILNRESNNEERIYLTQ